MKKGRVNIILVIVFIAGLSVMLYPLVSDYWNARTQSRAVATYNDSVQVMSEADYSELFAQAEAYNQALAQVENPLINFDQVEGYDELLDISGTGIMGYVTIEKIGVELPIYHGTEETVLQIAAGHLAGSSLPTGGLGTHSVISAHRGLPSARLFTQLDELEEGDTFVITVLDRTMTYMVDQIRIVEPHEIQDLEIDPNEDYCTLMTCTPYGINSHRLLVRGIRVENAREVSEIYVAAEAHQVDTTVVAIAIAIGLLIVIAAALALVQLVKKLLSGHEKDTAGQDGDKDTGRNEP